VGESRGVYRVFVGEHERKKLFGRPRCRWKIILRWIFWRGYGGVDWIELARDKDSDGHV
jgi:hypothetical protein